MTKETAYWLKTTFSEQEIGFAVRRLELNKIKTDQNTESYISVCSMVSAEGRVLYILGVI